MAAKAARFRHAIDELLQRLGLSRYGLRMGLRPYLANCSSVDVVVVAGGWH